MTRRRWLALAGVALLGAAPLVLPEFQVTLLNYIGLYSIVALGLVLVTGVAGLTSVGHAALVGVAAYATAVPTLAEISGKDAATLQAAWDKAVAADAGNAEKFFNQIDGAKRIDAKKEADKRTAEIAKVVEALLAAGK